MGILNTDLWYPKLSPVLSVLGLGGGVGSNLSGGAPIFEGPGYAEFYTPGSTQWTAPSGVTRARVVVIGGGGGGGRYTGGGGGGAAMKLYTNI